jgi:hypothetical protein
MIVQAGKIMYSEKQNYFFLVSLMALLLQVYKVASNFFYRAVYLMCAVHLAELRKVNK